MLLLSSAVMRSYTTVRSMPVVASVPPVVLVGLLRRLTGGGGQSRGVSIGGSRQPPASPTASPRTASGWRSWELRVQAALRSGKWIRGTANVVSSRSTVDNSNQGGGNDNNNDNGNNNNNNNNNGNGGGGGRNGGGGRAPVFWAVATTTAVGALATSSSGNSNNTQREERRRMAKHLHKRKRVEQQRTLELPAAVIPVALGIGVVLHVTRLLLVVCPLVGAFVLYMLRLIPARTFYTCLRNTLVWAGPTFIKLGQWMATRPDVFSLELCQCLGSLHADAPMHPFEHTQEILKREWGIDSLDEVFEEFDPKPLHSGCVAQIHKAKLRAEYVASPEEQEKSNKAGGLWGRLLAAVGVKKHKSPSVYTDINQFLAEGMLPTQAEVAVKILHPYVERRVSWDLAFMRFCAGIVHRIPGCQWFGMKEAVESFAGTLVQHLDMTVEAVHLGNFNRLFPRGGEEGLPSTVQFPIPYMEFVTPSILIESFEQGTLISEWIPKASMDDCHSVARLGLSAFLQMLFHHNYVHADLHPGNILVDQRPDGGIRVVLVDTGMVTILSEQQWINFVELYACVLSGDSRHAAEIMRTRAPRCACNDNEGFAKAMGGIIDEYNNAKSISLIQIGTTLNKILSTVFRYKVGLDSSTSSLVVSIVIMEGIARALNSDIDLVTASQPYVIEWILSHPGTCVKYLVPILNSM